MTTTPPAARTALFDDVTRWYDDHGRDLPWRSTDCSAWGVLVSEVMSQQTPVARVAPRWIAWMERWPTPRDLARASSSEVLVAWERLGYPRRALRLRDCAIALVRDHRGEVPADEAALRALPGIGEYTAAAVMAFAFGRRSVVVDTNIRRVEARAVTGIALPMPSMTTAERRLADSLVPVEDAAAAHWSVAVMELGAVVCTARAPDCGTCPIARRCVWLLAGQPADAHADDRRPQPWHGTDRQVRGRILAALREVPGHRLALASLTVPDNDQRSRCLAGLVEDGLVHHEDDDLVLGSPPEDVSR